MRQAPGYAPTETSTATKTSTDPIDVPQPVTVIGKALIRDLAMQGIGDATRYAAGVGMAQGEGNRDTLILRGNSSTADLFVDGLRDDVQYFRDLYDIEQVEILTGPNAMIFGRGGSGGLVNRVSKRAGWQRGGSVDLLLGAYGRARASADFNAPLGNDAALRVNALAEESGSFRDDVHASRRGVHPVLALRAGASTLVELGAERFTDARTADRGVPSFHGRPVDVDPATFFGDPARSRSTAGVSAFDASVTHDFAGGAQLRNHARIADYDKFYQNVFPGAVSGDGDTVSVSAYNNATWRRNLINQTDLVFDLGSGAVRHTVLLGMELARQETDNLRNTGYFPADGCAATNTTSYCGLSLQDPRYTGAIEFKPSATDADNHGVARSAALYVQDQVALGKRWQAIIGLRLDRFEVDFDNHRTGDQLRSSDQTLSPRLGLVYEAAPELNLYASLGRAFLPRSGEQLSSLTPTNAALEPEAFRNAEVGAKWRPTAGLLASAAVYRLERDNVAVVDPTDPNALVLLEGKAQRVRGVELSLAGDLAPRWHVIGAAAFQDGELLQDLKTSSSAALPAGTILAQLPRRSASLWNRFDVDSHWGVGVGLLGRSAIYASTSNTVTLPGYVRVDAALYYRASAKLRLQLNVENVGDTGYAATANSDNNISPGGPRTFNLGLHLEL